MVHHRWTYKQKIKHIGLTIHHQNTAERTWHMVNKCKEMEQDYTGNNFTRHLNPPHLLTNFDELNILADLMENRLGLLYTNLLINCHRHQNCFDAVWKVTVNLSFLRLQHKITRIQRIRQGTKNEGKGKEERKRQTKQWLIMLNRFPEDNK